MRILSLPLPASGGCWHLGGYGHITPVSAFVLTSPSPLCVYLPLLFSYKELCDGIEGLGASFRITSSYQNPQFNHHIGNVGSRN